MAIEMSRQVHPTHRLTNCLLCILGGLEHYRAGSFRSAIQSNIDISPDDVTSSTEKILQVLPTGLIRKLQASELRAER